MLGYEGTKCQGDTVFTGQVIGCQVHAFEKAIRPLFCRPCYLSTILHTYVKEFWKITHMGVNDTAAI